MRVEAMPTLLCHSTGQAIDVQGQVIPGLYCGGELTEGFNQHGPMHGPGVIAGKYMAVEPSTI
jgi:hypothetical protein